MLLLTQHYLTSLIVKCAQERVMHNGVRDTLTEVRSRYWIIRGRQFIQKMIFKCVVCRKYEAIPYRPLPPPPPLPSFRVTAEPPFTYTGVDLAGPLYLKKTDLMQNKKGWICLYICCIVRAVHLEVVLDMTTEGFLQSFKQFSSRRGFPRKVISDNSSTFKGAAKTVETILRHPKVQQHFTGMGLEWKFNVEKALWWGGIFERMIRSVKCCLRKTIGKSVLTLNELVTAVTEVEAILIHDHCLMFRVKIQKNHSPPHTCYMEGGSTTCLIH